MDGVTMDLPKTSKQQNFNGNASRVGVAAVYVPFLQTNTPFPKVLRDLFLALINS